MNLLVLGGGHFAGRAAVETAVARGHSVTVFNRGKTTLAVAPGVEWIRGDRDSDLGRLEGRTWDGVIDMCAFYPRHVESLLKTLKGRIGHYIFVSSVSAYADMDEPGRDETSPLAQPISGAPETFAAETYGPFKAMCEASALQWGPASTLMVRPGILVGPNDPTGRFSYWVQRVAAGGEILAPGNPEAPLQVIDGRDLGEWMVEKAETVTTGSFNIVGPESPLTFREMLETAAAALNVRPQFTWADDEFLIGKKAADWSQLPLYLPPTSPRGREIFRVSGKAAFANGLKVRPLAETIADNARWLEGPHSSGAKKIGLSRERESELLAQWHAR
ncbi:MAG TPA: NAD-dependent epimerase/dehydratase family protein [Opitutaceae bacterium]